MTTTSPTPAASRSLLPLDRISFAAIVLLFGASIGAALIAAAFRMQVRPELVVAGVAVLAVAVAVGLGAVVARDRAAAARVVPSLIGFSLPRIRPGHTIIQVAIFALVVPVAGVWLMMNHLLPVLQDLTGLAPQSGVSDDRDSWYASVPLTWVVVSIIAAVVSEEVMFRGPGLTLWRLRDYTTNRIGRAALTWGAIVGGMALSAIAFGFIHADYSAWNVLTAAIFGAVIYPLVLATGSLWPSIVAHTLWNLVAFGALTL